jgi:hypothetical protein
METSTHPDVIDVLDGQSSCMRIFRTAQVDDLPEPAAAYLRHAIAPGTWLPSRIRLRMHGHIKVGVWLPFQAEQVIDTELGFQWTASIADGLLRGIDSFDHHQGQTRFGIGGKIPVVSADGPQVSHSAFGRFMAEQAAWMPGNLLPDTGTHWVALNATEAVAHVPADGSFTRLHLGVEPDGRLRDIRMSRWGRSAGRYGYQPFGMRADAEATFGGFTVVSQGRVGWWYGTDRWTRGEFFRFTIDDLCPF